MYTVLIADDERIEREGVRSIVEKEDREFRILEAANGKEAARILEGEHVDILITDIRMPHKSGLKLVTEAADRGEIPQVIVFTGYHDFEYIRTAIRCGICDYLLKPVDPGEFSAAFRTAVKNLDDQNERKRADESKKKFLDQHFLAKYIMDGRKVTLDRASRQTDIKKWEEIHYMIVVEASTGFFENTDENFQDTLEKEFGPSMLYLNLNMEQSLILIRERRTDYVKLAENLLEWLNRTYQRSFYLAVSRYIEKYLEFPETYKKLDELLDDRFYHTRRHLFFQESDTVTKGIIEQGELLGMLERDIRDRDGEHLKIHFRKIVAKYRGNRQFPSMYIKFVFSNIVKELWNSSVLVRSGEISGLIDELYGCATIDDVIRMTEKQVEEFLRILAEDKGSVRFKVESVKKYIGYHYGSVIQLDMLADKLYISPGYLSMIFKKETGQNLNQYLKNIRLEKAAELLTGTELPVSEAGKQTGFNNMSYFCRCFRQKYGYTPENYRTLMREKEEIPSIS